MPIGGILFVIIITSTSEVSNVAMLSVTEGSILKGIEVVMPLGVCIDVSFIKIYPMVQRLLRHTWTMIL